MTGVYTLIFVAVFAPGLWAMSLLDVHEAFTRRRRNRRSAEMRAGKRE